jgi:hypothetical protein
MPLAPLSRRRKVNLSTVLGELVQTTAGLIAATARSNSSSIDATRPSLTSIACHCQQPIRAISQVIRSGNATEVRAPRVMNNGLSDSPCQIPFRRVRIARTMDGVCGSHKVEEGSGR